MKSVMRAMVLEAAGRAVKSKVKDFGRVWDYSGPSAPVPRDRMVRPVNGG